MGWWRKLFGSSEDTLAIMNHSCLKGCLVSIWAQKNLAFVLTWTLNMVENAGVTKFAILKVFACRGMIEAAVPSFGTVAWEKFAFGWPSFERANLQFFLVWFTSFRFLYLLLRRARSFHLFGWRHFALRFFCFDVALLVVCLFNFALNLPFFWCMERLFLNF